MSAGVAVLVSAAVFTWPWRTRAAARRRLLGRHLDVAAGRETAGHRPTLRIDAVANSVDLLALALQGGGGVVEAIESVAADSPPPVRNQLSSVGAALRWGVADEEAWAVVPAVWAPAARALRLSRQAGLPPADMLRRAAEELRAADNAHVEAASARVAVRVVLPLGLAFLPAFVLTTVVPVVIALARATLSG